MIETLTISYLVVGALFSILMYTQIKDDPRLKETTKISFYSFLFWPLFVVILLYAAWLNRKNF